jgi:hypothetical protein
MLNYCLIFSDDESEPNNASRASNSVPIGADFQNLLDKAST